MSRPLFTDGRPADWTTKALFRRPGNAWPRATDEQLARDLDREERGLPRLEPLELAVAGLGRLEGAAMRVLITREAGGDLDAALRELADVLLDQETLEEREARREHMRRCRVPS